MTPVSSGLRAGLRAEHGLGLDNAIDSLGVSEPLREDAFTRTLRLERKRTERSSRRFVLMLLEPGASAREGDASVLEQVMETVSRSTRETDVKGWYKQGDIVGIIFTEVGDTDPRAIVEILKSRIIDVLTTGLRIDRRSEIRVSLHVYPEDSFKQWRGGPYDLALYPDACKDADARKVRLLLKRSIDVAGSLAALVLLSPLILGIAAVIKLTSRGSIFFRQERVGLDGRRFTFLKFRSMHAGNDSAIHREYTKRLISGAPGTGNVGGHRPAIYKLSNDPRVTGIGRLLRRTSLDELPQFFNVLAGTMSLVGPRPPIPYELDSYAVWHRRRLLSVKPGITGLWQVSGRSRVPFDQMVRLDLEYAKTWSLWLDLRILCLTPRAVIRGEGAY